MSGFVKFIFGIVIVIILMWVAFFAFVGTEVVQEGGIKNALTEWGKDARDIMHDVMEHDPGKEE